MNIRGWSSLLPLAAVVGFALAGPARAEDPIKLGMISSLSGPIGDQGSEYANGAKLAVEAINKAGGITSLGNRQIALDLLDDTSVPAVTRTLAIKLISSDKVPIILGPFASGPCLAAAPVGEQMERALICSAASDEVTKQGFHYVFNRATLAGSFTSAGFAVVKGLSDSSGLDLRKVAVIYEDGAYGTSGNAQADAAAKQYGVTLTDRIAFHTNTADLSPVVSRAVASGAKALLLLTYTGDAVNIIRAVRTLKAPVLILGSGAWNATMVKLGEPANGMVALADWNDDLPKPDVVEFREAYKTAFGFYPGTAGAWGWSDMYFLKAALEKAASTDPKVLRDTIAELKLKEGPSVGIMPYDTYGFDSDGLAIDQIGRVIATQLQGGKFVTIWPGKVSTAKLDPASLK